ncbi:energy-coupling factor ABC transporter ATP-binding protein [Rhodopseudomonas palustris]|uniref:energy-coupling factor ABC transporter ATP-binding protein n=1 Tax=Rhodopseudomonas palustris TaxID=1076 RepID=UPI00030233F3|nr:ABC transporter ATP-binding protein [Rhodopseudomonas palustris]
MSTTPGAQAIVFSDVRLARDGREVLRRVDFRIDEARIGILGQNGSGKSTLLRMMIGLIAPSQGRVTVGGLDPHHDCVAVRDRMGFLFQTPDNQIVYPIVHEDLAFGLKARGLSRQMVSARIAASLDRLGIGDLAARRVHELSGGERQLVALAGVLTREPPTILFDEPTSQLDLANRNRFRRLLAGMSEQAIVATHDLELVEDFDRVLVIESGRVVVDAAPAEAIARYRELCR